MENRMDNKSSQKKKKEWKDYLLSSGLPLEQSVIQILRKMGIEWIREYKYERLNENGLPTIFSVDIHAQVIELIASIFLFNVNIDMQRQPNGFLFLMNMR